MDLKNLSDDELDHLRQQIAIERERRDDLALIPNQISDLADRYIKRGGDPGALPKIPNDVDTDPEPAPDPEPEAPADEPDPEPEPDPDPAPGNP